MWRRPPAPTASTSTTLRSSTTPPAADVHPSVDVPLDVDGLAGEPEVGLGLAQGLHHRRLQRPASRLRDDARHGLDVGLDELQPLHQLVRHGLRHPEHDVVVHRRADTVLLRPEEHLGAGLPVGRDRLRLPDVDRSHQRQRMVGAERALLRNHLRLGHRTHRPDA